MSLMWWTKKCGECGKSFPLCTYDVANYVYKRFKREGDTTKLIYFCSYSCMRKFDQDRAERKKKKED